MEGWGEVAYILDSLRPGPRKVLEERRVGQPVRITRQKRQFWLFLWLKSAAAARRGWGVGGHLETIARWMTGAITRIRLCSPFIPPTERVAKSDFAKVAAPQARLGVVGAIQ